LNDATRWQYELNNIYFCYNFLVFKGFFAVISILSQNIPATPTPHKTQLKTAIYKAHNN
jgi:hypothetical protein